MIKYAYLDKAGIMHVVSDEKTAKEYSKTGKCVKTEIKATGGYPVAYVEEIKREDEVIVYSGTDMKIDAHGARIKPIAELAALYDECARA